MKIIKGSFLLLLFLSGNAFASTTICHSGGTPGTNWSIGSGTGKTYQDVYSYIVLNKLAPTDNGSTGCYAYDYVENNDYVCIPGYTQGNYWTFPYPEEFYVDSVTSSTSTCAFSGTVPRVKLKTYASQAGQSDVTACLIDYTWQLTPTSWFAAGSDSGSCTFNSINYFKIRVKPLSGMLCTCQDPPCTCNEKPWCRSKVDSTPPNSSEARFTSNRLPTGYYAKELDNADCSISGIAVEGEYELKEASNNSISNICANAYEHDGGLIPANYLITSTSNSACSYNTSNGNRKFSTVSKPTSNTVEDVCAAKDTSQPPNYQLSFGSATGYVITDKDGVSTSTCNSGVAYTVKKPTSGTTTNVCPESFFFQGGVPVGYVWSGGTGATWDGSGPECTMSISKITSSTTSVTGCMAIGMYPPVGWVPVDVSETTSCNATAGYYRVTLEPAEDQTIIEWIAGAAPFVPDGYVIVPTNQSGCTLGACQKIRLATVVAAGNDYVCTDTPLPAGFDYSGSSTSATSSSDYCQSHEKIQLAFLLPASTASPPNTFIATEQDVKSLPGGMPNIPYN